MNQLKGFCPVCCSLDFPTLNASLSCPASSAHHFKKKKKKVKSQNKTIEEETKLVVISQKGVSISLVGGKVQLKCCVFVD